VENITALLLRGPPHTSVYIYTLCQHDACWSTLKLRTNKPIPSSPRTTLIASATYVSFNCDKCYGRYEYLEIVLN